MIAKVYEDALKIILEHACDGTPVVAKAEETVEDDYWITGAVCFILELQSIILYFEHGSL